MQIGTKKLAWLQQAGEESVSLSCTLNPASGICRIVATDLLPNIVRTYCTLLLYEVETTGWKTLLFLQKRVWEIVCTVFLPPPPINHPSPASVWHLAKRDRGIPHSRACVKGAKKVVEKNSRTTTRHYTDTDMSQRTTKNIRISALTERSFCFHAIFLGSKPQERIWGGI